jgi:hypothetical protein
MGPPTMDSEQSIRIKIRIKIGSRLSKYSIAIFSISANP